jgi:hypothetical protein
MTYDVGDMVIREHDDGTTTWMIILRHCEEDFFYCETFTLHTHARKPVHRLVSHYTTDAWFSTKDTEDCSYGCTICRHGCNVRMLRNEEEKAKTST